MRARGTAARIELRLERQRDSLNDTATAWATERQAARHLDDLDDKPGEKAPS